MQFPILTPAELDKARSLHGQWRYGDGTWTFFTTIPERLLAALDAASARIAELEALVQKLEGMNQNAAKAAEVLADKHNELARQGSADAVRIAELEARIKDLEEERTEIMLRWIPRCNDAEAERDLLLVEGKRLQDRYDALSREMCANGAMYRDIIAGLKAELAEREEPAVYVSDLTPDQITAIRKAFARPERDQVIAAPCPTAQPVQPRVCHTCLHRDAELFGKPCRDCAAWDYRPKWTPAVAPVEG